MFIHCLHCRQASHTFNYSCCFTLSLSFYCSLCQDPSLFSHSDGFRHVFDFLVFMISRTWLVLVVSHAFHVLSFPRFPRFLNCLAFSLSPRIPHVCLSLAILCYTILSAPYYSILYYTTQDYNTLYYTILYTMLYSAILYYSAPYHTTLYYTTQD